LNTTAASWVGPAQAADIQQKINRKRRLIALKAAFFNAKMRLEAPH
jgi:hypothetical protein